MRVRSSSREKITLYSANRLVMLRRQRQHGHRGTRQQNGDAAPIPGECFRCAGRRASTSAIAAKANPKMACCDFANTSAVPNTM